MCGTCLGTVSCTPNSQPPFLSCWPNLSSTHDRGRKCLMLIFPSLPHTAALCNPTLADNLRSSLLARERWRRRRWWCADRSQKRFFSLKKREMSKKSLPLFPIRVPEAGGASVAIRWKVRRSAKKWRVVELKGRKSLCHRWHWWQLSQRGSTKLQTSYCVK